MIKTVNCPIRGHNHSLPLVPDPSRPDLVIAKCGDRIVHREAAISKTAGEFGYLLKMTVAQLTSLAEWDQVESPRPSKKADIVEAIMKVRSQVPAQTPGYIVPDYKE